MALAVTDWEGDIDRESEALGELLAEDDNVALCVEDCEALSEFDGDELVLTVTACDADAEADDEGDLL